MKRTTGPQGLFRDAVTLFQAGKLDKADRKCRQIITADPTQTDAMHLRAMIAMHRQDAATAITIMQRALTIKPLDTALLCNLGNMHMTVGQTGDALTRFLGAIAIDPNHEQARTGAGTLLVEQGKFHAAEPHFRNVLKRAPRHVEALLGLAEALDGQARAADAAEIARRAIAAAPKNPLAQSRLATALGQLHDFDDAINAHRRAMALSDNAPSYWFGLVANLAAFGRMAEAEAECRALIAAHPDFAPAHVRLSTLVRLSSAAEIADLERLLGLKNISLRDRIQMEFALGAAMEGQGAYEQAFAYYEQGNRRTREITPYSKEKVISGFAEIKSAFSSDTFARHSGAGCADPTPIFIVGMPRSGTTLVDQILCSHPEVEGANELGSIPRLFAELINSTGARAPEDALAAATGEQLRHFGETYLKELRTYSSDARFIIDKLPGNFAFLGFIALILPQAKIVHCRRDPLDTCLSIYKTRFVRGSIDYGYDLAELGHYYRLYEDLMRFWDGVLPKKPIGVSYEDLVANTRAESERVLHELGLDWSENCDRFYETRRSVLTASMAQVRRPIYTSSVGKATRFGAALDPLRRALQGSGTSRSPTAD